MFPNGSLTNDNNIRDQHKVSNIFLTLKAKGRHKWWPKKKMKEQKQKQEPVHISFQPFLGMAASLVYILAIDWYPLKSPDRRRLPVQN